MEFSVKQADSRPLYGGLDTINLKLLEDKMSCHCAISVQMNESKMPNHYIIFMPSIKKIIVNLRLITCELHST